jgi:DNA-binding CsgD family transcriptional regulator
MRVERDDARKLSQEAQEKLRKQAIRLRKKGKTYTEIAETVGGHHNTVWK